MEDVQAIDWAETIGKEARGARDDGDLGEVQAAEQNYVVTERGIIEKDRFYIPKYLVYGFDGHTLWFEITEEEANQFKRESPPAYGEYVRYKKPSYAHGIDVEGSVPKVDKGPRA